MSVLAFIVGLFAVVASIGSFVYGVKAVLVAGGEMDERAHQASMRCIGWLIVAALFFMVAK